MCRSRSSQADAAIELFLRVFSRAGLERVFGTLEKRKKGVPASVQHFARHGARYVETVEAVVRFLQGRDPGLALRVVGRELLPEGPRFSAILESDEKGDPLAWAFGGLGISDRAKQLASLYGQTTSG